MALLILAQSYQCILGLASHPRPSLPRSRSEWDDCQRGRFRRLPAFMRLCASLGDPALLSASVATAEFMARLKLKDLHLLPLHRLGHSKHEQLDLNYEYTEVPSPSRDALCSRQDIFETAGLNCYVGSETLF